MAVHLRATNRSIGLESDFGEQFSMIVARSEWQSKTNQIFGLESGSSPIRICLRRTQCKSVHRSTARAVDSIFPPLQIRRRIMCLSQSQNLAGVAVEVNKAGGMYSVSGIMSCQRMWRVLPRTTVRLSISSARRAVQGRDAGSGIAGFRHCGFRMPQRPQVLAHPRNSRHRAGIPDFAPD